MDSRYCFDYSSMPQIETRCCFWQSVFLNGCKWTEITKLTIKKVGMLIGPFVGGLLYDLSGKRKEAPFLVIVVLLFLDGIARLIIKGTGHKEEKANFIQILSVMPLPKRRQKDFLKF
jgi:hypothetical protein